MYSRLAIVATATVAVLVALAPASATPSKTRFRVTSSLDGKTVLPHRIHWVAYPRPRTGVSTVQFLIDGKLRWVENSPPYSYSDDGGYLVTSWLAAGRHRFTVLAKFAGGKKATRTVVARVIKEPDPPLALAGTWRRKVLKEVPPDPAYPGDAVPAGQWTLVFDRRWIEAHFPGTFDPRTSPQTGAGNILLDDYTVGADRFTVYGAVTTGRMNPNVAAGGGWWCGPGGPRGTYAWSVSGDALTLAGRDGCSQRLGIYAGKWTKVR